MMKKIPLQAYYCWAPHFSIFAAPQTAEQLRELVNQTITPLMKRTDDTGHGGGGDISRQTLLFHPGPGPMLPGSVR